MSFPSVLAVMVLSCLGIGFLPDLNAQTCNYSDSSLIVLEGGDPLPNEGLPYPPTIYSLSDSVLPTSTEVIVMSPGTFESSPFAPGILVDSMAYDRKGGVVYVATTDPSDFMTGRKIFGIPLPLSTGTPVEIATLTISPSERVASMSVDYTNSNKVYVLIEDSSNISFRVDRFSRLDTLTSGLGLEPILAGAPNPFAAAPLLMRHKRGTNATSEGSLIIAIDNDGSPELYDIPIAGPFPITSLPTPLDSNLFSGLPTVDARIFDSLEYDPYSNSIFAVRRDVVISDESAHLMNYPMSNLETPTSSDITSSISATDYSLIDDCRRITINLKDTITPANQRVFLRCTPQVFSPPSTQLNGIVTFDSTLTEVNPLRQDGTQIAPGSYKPPVIATAIVSCCSTTNDFDQDGDLIKDCQDLQPFVFDSPPPTPTPTPTPGSNDVDGDTIPDVIDDCPNDFAPEDDLILGGVLGFGCPCIDRLDNDSDGLLNCTELPADQNIPVGTQCTDTGDADKDNTANCNDPCPTDPNKVLPLVCGCEVPEVVGCKDPCTNGVQDLGCGCGISPCTDPSKTVLTKFTKITEAAVITVTSDPVTGKKNVEITLKKFDSALLTKEFSTQAQKPAKLTVKYDISVQKIEGTKKKSVIRRTVRSNSVLLRKLSSGLYTAKYRALIKSKDKREGSKEKTVAKTSFSPARTFSF